MLDVKELERNLLDDYLKELEGRVSLPELHKSRYHLWESLVKGTLRFPANRQERETIDWALMASYEDVRGTPQHNLDSFVMCQDGWNVMPGYEAERLDLLDVEGFMRCFGVDRATALKIKSVHRREVCIELEWVKVH